MLKRIIKIPFLFMKTILRIVFYLLNAFFGFLFGWIPDWDDRMSGEDFEKYVKEILLRIGYKKVKLTKRSGDYGIDILASYRHQSYAIQCKFYGKTVGVSAVQQAYAGCEYYGYDIPVVVTNNRFTAQAIALAQSNGVLLWDQDELKRMKRKANSHSLFHKRYHEVKEEPLLYEAVIDLLLEEGYASTDLLVKRLHYSEQKAFYILEDLEFYDLVSSEDHIGLRDLYFSSKEDVSKRR